MAYRLLARSMQDEQRDGIATFVMPGKEQLVAIIAEQGLLRAETLRFYDELRSPEGIGLPALEQGTGTRVQRFRKSINSRARKTLKRERLSDRYSLAMRELIDRKLKKGEDVVAAPETDEPEEDAGAGGDEVDLMQVLKDSQQQNESSSGTGRSDKRSRTRSKRRSKGHTGKDKTGAPLDHMSKTQLYSRARKLDIAGRSNITKAELIEAIEAHT